MDSLVVNSWTLKVIHWSYVVLSRVKALKSLVLNEKLDENRNYRANEELVKWERTMKELIEKKTFRDRSAADYDAYKAEELKYNILPS